jgi:hypothetical protein
MATKKHGVFIEAPTESQQHEAGPSVLWLLVISTVLAVSILGFVRLMFPDSISTYRRRRPAVARRFRSPTYCVNQQREIDQLALRP